MYRGKAKDVYDVGEGQVALVFRDSVTAGNGAYRDEAPGKGELAAALTAHMFRLMGEAGIPTHYVSFRRPNMLVARRVNVLPVEVIVRLYAYGSQLKRMPLIPRLKRLSAPLVEYHYKDDSLGDPLVLREDVLEAGIATEGELRTVEEMAVRAALLVNGLAERAGAQLLDMKLEFGRLDDGIVICDEVSGDTMRVVYGGEHLDKEYYRATRDAVGLVERYRRLNKLFNVEV